MQAKIIELPSEPRRERRIVPARQSAIDALPPGSGWWRVEDIPGLYVEALAQSKSFVLQRKVQGKLVKVRLGAITLREARRQAMLHWAKLKPKPVRAGSVTLEQAVEQYLEGRSLSQATLRCYRDAYRRFLSLWGNRTLAEVGQDRVGVRRLISKVTNEHGPALANHTLRLLSAVYRWWRKVDAELPEPPTVAVTAHQIKPRDWAMDDEALREWWNAVKRLRNPAKRVWWVAALLTGARKRSIEHLKWDDLDFERNVIRFAVAKRAPYAVPMCSRLRELLLAWRAHPDRLPCEWVFPSPVSGGPMKDVRDDKRGVKSPHRLRHTYRTTLAALGAPPDIARLLLGHAVGRDVSAGYITRHAPALIEAMREWSERVCAAYERSLDERLDPGRILEPSRPNT